MIALGPVVPLLAAAGILLAGNGLFGTLITMRAQAEAFSLNEIGLLGTAYFAGFLVGTWRVTHLINAVGPIRVFASLAALGACGALILVMFVEPTTWIILRFLTGFCMAGLFTVVESWLNAAADNNERGRLLSIYRLIDLAAVTGSQLIIPVIGISGFHPFSLLAILLCLSLVPISLSRRGSPQLTAGTFRFDLIEVWRISPLAAIGVFAIGLTTSSFRLVGPVYASGVGLDLTGVATFMAVGIAGGTVLQYPLGWLSDRYDRRWVLIGATLGASAAGLTLSLLPTKDPFLLYAGIFAFGAFALPLYSLSVAHANDHARADQYALLSAGLIFIFSLGASIGPLAASLVIDAFGTPAFFAYVSFVHFLLVIATLLRMASRPSVPVSQRVRYVSLMRTSPAIFRLARRRLGKKSQNGQPASPEPDSPAPDLPSSSRRTT